MLDMQNLQWKIIPEFPDYEINALGQIYNSRTQNLMRTSQTNFGHEKITLMADDHSRHTRSVALLVAEAFVEPPNSKCDTVVVLDGDLTNIVASNLIWRPRGLAWEYAHQFRVRQPMYFTNLSVRNVVTGAEYDSIMDAAMAEGLLAKDIWRSTWSGVALFPDRSIFEVIERV